MNRIVNKVSSSNILRKAAKPQGFKATDEEHFGRCMRLTNLGLLSKEPGRVFRRTDKPDCRPGAIAEMSDFDRYRQ